MQQLIQNYFFHVVQFVLHCIVSSYWCFWLLPKTRLVFGLRFVGYLLTILSNTAAVRSCVSRYNLYVQYRVESQVDFVRCVALLVAFGYFQAHVLDLSFKLDLLAVPVIIATVRLCITRCKMYVFVRSCHAKIHRVIDQISTIIMKFICVQTISRIQNTCMFLNFPRLV